MIWRPKQGLWHHTLEPMSRSRLLTVIAMTLTVASVLLPACVALPMGAVPTAMPSDCHGENGNMPAPSHTCCYAGHHAPATVEAAPAPVVLVVSVDLVYMSDDGHATDRHALPVSTDASPPPPAVLRI